MNKKTGPKSNTPERRAEILDYLINFGPFGIPTGTKKELASKWDCDYRTIDRDIDYVITHVKIPKMQKMGQKFLLSYEKALKVVSQKMQDEDSDIQLKGVAALNQTQDHFTKMCERYRFKEIVAEKIEIEENLNYNSLTKEECDEIIKRLGEE